jgi:hypothetical protein
MLALSLIVDFSSVRAALHKPDSAFFFPAQHECSSLMGDYFLEIQGM